MDGSWFNGLKNKYYNSPLCSNYFVMTLSTKSNSAVIKKPSPRYYITKMWNRNGL